MKAKRQKYTSSFASILLAIGCVFSLLIIFLFRSAEKLLPGRESYFLLRIAENPAFIDALSFGGRFTAYPLGLPYLLNLLPWALAIAMPFVFGILSIILFFLLLRDFNVKPRKTALAILLLSPSFIYLFNTLNTASAALFLALLGFWLFARKGGIRVLSPLVIALIPLFDLTIALLSMLLLLFYVFFKDKESKKLYFAALALFLASAGIYYSYIIKNAGFSWPMFNLWETGFNGALRSLLSDLGAPYGIGLFSLILAVFGIIAVWDAKYENKFAFFSIAALLVTSMFFPKALFMLSLFVAVFAAIGFMDILNSRWENRLFQRFVLLIMVCGIIFSALSFAQVFVNSEPDEGIVKGIGALSELPNGVVFSEYTRGHWISFAGKPNVMDENAYLAPDVNERFEDSQMLFKTRDIEEAGKIIKKYNIKYIWIDAGMKRRLWKEDEDGLLFLLKYNPDLKNKVYDVDGVEIWEISEGAYAGSGYEIR